MSSSKIKVRSGNAWAEVLNLKKRSSSAWVDGQAYVWDGDSWNALIDRTPDTKQYMTEWPNTWVASYNGSGSRIRTDVGFQGYYSSNNGNQKAMFGFNLANIKSSLSGSVVNRVMIDFVISHTYYNSGATFHWGTHNYAGTSSPATYGPLVTRDVAQHTNAPRTIFNLTLPVSVGNSLRDGKVSGLVLDTTDTSWNAYGSVSSVVLRIEYTK